MDNTKRKYYEVMNNLNDGLVMINDEWTRISNMSRSPVIPYLAQANKEFEVTTRHMMGVNLIEGIQCNFELWRTSADPIDRLHNLNWIYIILGKMDDVVTEVVYPSYEDMEDMDYNNHVKDVVSKLYLRYMDKAINFIGDYILERKQTKVVDNMIYASDGTCLDLNQVGVSTDSTFKGFDLGDDLITMEDLIEIQPLVAKDVPHQIVELVSHLNTVVRHNAEILGLVIGDYRELIRLNRLFEVDDEFELTMSEIREYISDLSKCIIEQTKWSRDELYPNEELYRVPVDYYIVKDIRTPDITLVNPQRGLFISYKDGILEGSVKHNTLDAYMTMFTVRLYTDPSVTIITETIHNMFHDSYQPMAKLIMDCLEQVGMLEQYIQPPKGWEHAPGTTEPVPVEL